MGNYPWYCGVSFAVSRDQGSARRCECWRRLHVVPQAIENTTVLKPDSKGTFFRTVLCRRRSDLWFDRHQAILNPLSVTTGALHESDGKRIVDNIS